VPPEHLGEDTTSGLLPVKELAIWVVGPFEHR
jgi:hypothetical protein